MHISYNAVLYNEFFFFQVKFALSWCIRPGGIVKAFVEIQNTNIHFYMVFEGEL